MVSDVVMVSLKCIAARLNPCSNGIWSLTCHSRDDQRRSRRVLILVLMEYGLWPMPLDSPPLDWDCLNPCSNGIWSLTPRLSFLDRSVSLGLNPCSNGIWSLTVHFNWGRPSGPVLILVLMEYGLWHARVHAYARIRTVLILVLMEYGLWLIDCPIKASSYWS